LEFLLDHPIPIQRELLRDLDQCGTDAVVWLLDGLVVEAAAIGLQQFAEQLNAESFAMLLDESAFGVERQ
jgi:hypothetical protein